MATVTRDNAFARGRWAAAPLTLTAARARWEPPALIGLLALSAVLYLWNLAASGWANAYYSAAVQAGTVSWKAFLFGSFDASNFVTVDKPPAALWVMELSARIFGLNSWSLLVPEALIGVGTVALTFFAVRRWFGPAAGLLAGAVVALTPVAALMFRFNNPDALLVLLTTGAVYATLRAVEDGRTRWLVLAGILVGGAFLAKMLQGFIVLPVLGGVYLLAGPPRLGKRLWQLGAAALAVLVSAGWWVALVQLTPASLRPYVGGSQTNSLLELIFGYNGFGRITGNERGSVGGRPIAGAMWGPTGWDRLFQPDFGGQVAWLIPAALVLLAAGLWLTLRRPRTDILRASLLAWGGTLLLTGAVISLAQGIIHPYYTIALAPAIGAGVAMGGVLLWRRRSQLPARAALAVAVAAASITGFALLARSPQWYPELRYAVIGAGLAAAVLLIGLPASAGRWLAAAGVVGLIASLAGPAAYTLDTVAVAHAGAIPSAGPAVTRGFGPGGGFGGRRTFAGAPPGGFPQGGGFRRFGPPAAGSVPGGFTGGIPARGIPAGGFAGGIPGGFAGAPGGPGGPGGGLLNGSTPGSALVSLLKDGAGRYSWVAATVGANEAAGYQLATGDPVMAIGGFNGTDPTPTLARFQEYVQQGRVHYFIAGGRGFGGFGRGGSQGSGSEIASWVESSFASQTVGGVTVYDLSAPLTSG